MLRSLSGTRSGSSACLCVRLRSAARKSSRTVCRTRWISSGVSSCMDIRWSKTHSGRTRVAYSPEPVVNQHFRNRSEALAWRSRANAPASGQIHTPTIWHPPTAWRHVELSAFDGSETTHPVEPSRAERLDVSRVASPRDSTLTIWGLPSCLGSSNRATTTRCVALVYMPDPALPGGPHRLASWSPSSPSVAVGALDIRRRLRHKRLGLAPPSGDPQGGGHYEAGSGFGYRLAYGIQARGGCRPLGAIDRGAIHLAPRPIRTSLSVSGLPCSRM